MTLGQAIRTAKCPGMYSQAERDMAIIVLAHNVNDDHKTFSIVLENDRRGYIAKLQEYTEAVSA